MTNADPSEKPYEASNQIIENCGSSSSSLVSISVPGCLPRRSLTLDHSLQRHLHVARRDVVHTQCASNERVPSRHLRRVSLERSHFLRRGLRAKVSLCPHFVTFFQGVCIIAYAHRRRFEKELEKLRKEMELASATGSLTTPSSANSPYPDHDPLSPNGDSSQGDMDVNGSPLVLPGTNQSGADLQVPELVLGAVAEGESGKTKSA